VASPEALQRDVCWHHTRTPRAYGATCNSRPQCVATSPPRGNRAGRSPGAGSHRRLLLSAHNEGACCLRREARPTVKGGPAARRSGKAVAGGVRAGAEAVIRQAQPVVAMRPLRA
jgi:hypothetical protein